MEKKESKKAQRASVPIVVPNENHEITSNFQEFERILLHDDIKDRNIIVVSIAGAPRKGKSFLMNFCAHYLLSKYNSPNHKSNTSVWLKDDENLSSGFSWRAGTKKVTNGIQMWPEIYCADLNGEKVAIVLLDTQGTFDKDCTVKESVIMFALSTILSSIQIYNVSQTIEGHDLQHLQLFTEYARLSNLDETSENPFQKLQFLIRDWCAPFEHDYGAKGGQEFLESVLKVSDDQPEELRQIRELIKSCFSDIRCFLMPEPGENVKYNDKFDGKISDINPKFLQYLREFIPSLLAPENLIVKKIHGQKIKAKDFVEQFQNYVNLFSSFDDLPEPKTMVMSIAEMSYENTLKEAIKVYNEEMNNYCDERKAEFVDVSNLQSKHDSCKTRALEFFENSRCKIGGNEIRNKFLQELDENIESDYCEYLGHVQRTNELVVENNKEKAFKNALEFYRKTISEVFASGSDEPEFIELQLVKNKHVSSKTKAFEIFDDTRGNIGKEEDYKTTRDSLDMEIDLVYDHIIAQVKAINELVVESNREKAFKEALKFYQTSMANYSTNSPDKPIYKESDSIEKKHTSFKIDALKMFDDIKGNKGEDEDYKLHRGDLEKEIDMEYNKILNNVQTTNTLVVEKNCEKAYKKAMKFYQDSMEKCLEQNNSNGCEYREPQLIEQKHTASKTRALKIFDDMRGNIGKKDDYEHHRSILDKDIDLRYNNIVKQVESMNAIAVEKHREYIFNHLSEFYRKWMADDSKHNFYGSKYKPLETIKDRHIHWTNLVFESFADMAKKVGKEEFYDDTRRKLEKFCEYTLKDIEIEALNFNAAIDHQTCYEALLSGVNYCRISSGSLSEKENMVWRRFNEAVREVTNRELLKYTRTQLKDEIRRMKNQEGKSWLNFVKGLGVVTAVLSVPFLPFVPIIGAIGAAGGLAVAAGTAIADGVVGNDDEENSS